MAEREEIESTPFNMAMIFYIRINKLMDRRDESAIEGDVISWYTRSKVVYRNVKFKFNDKERKKFVSLYIKAKNQLNMAMGGDRRTRAQIETITFSNAADILDQIDGDLTETMQKYNMIFPNISNNGLKELERRFGLNK